MLPRRMTRLKAVFFPAAIWLAGFSIAQAQIVADPYAKSGPADEEREFIASHTGQPNAPETLATLKELYAAAAKYYATDSDGHLFLRYTLTGADGGSGISGVPLTWTAFGNGLKSGQIILIRLPETPSAATSPAPTPKIIEYTVRWLPQSVAPAPSPAPETPDDSSSAATAPTLVIDSGSTDPAKAAAQKTAALIQSFQASYKPFLERHTGLQDLLGALAQDADGDANQSSDLLNDQKQTFAADLNRVIDLALSLSKRPPSSPPEQTSADWASAAAIAEQLAAVQLGLGPAPTDVVGIPTIAKPSPDPQTAAKVALLVSTYIQSVLAKDADFLARDQGYNRGLLTLDSAAQSVMTQEGGPSSVQILNFITSLNDCVHGADLYSKRPTVSDANAARGVKGLTTDVKSIVAENAAYWQMFVFMLNGMT
jgi:hypothetical protein